MSYEVRKLNPWKPETDPQRIAVLGKLGEELGELTQMVNRCIIQGLEESEPVTGVPNRVALQKEIADVLATTTLAILYLKLDGDFVAQRGAGKAEELGGWYDTLA